LKNILFAIAATIVLANCSTITTGTQQSVFIDTPKVMGATCRLTDSKTGTWNLPASPGSVSVLKGDGPMNIACSKEGYETATISVDETLVAATLGNILIGGGVGFLIDAASGAAQEYPSKITVWMKPKAWSSDAEEKAWLEEKQKFDEAEAEKLRKQQEQS